MSKKWYDYTPIGWITNAATKLLGGNSNPFGDVMSGVSDTLFGTTFNQDRQILQQQVYNSAEAQINRDWQFDMMKYQNEYNSPSAMMQRFRDAGLNPSLAISGSAPAFASASPSGGNAATSALSTAQHGNLSLSDMLLGAQIGNIEADTELKKGQTKATEIRNAVDGMNAEAFTTFYQQNKNDIVRVMAQDLQMRDNEFLLSNLENFEALWNATIMFGLDYSQAIKVARFGNMGLDIDDYAEIFSSINVQEMYDKHKRLFVGGYDAEIATNAAVRAVNMAIEQKKRKDIDIWTSLNNAAKFGDKWEKIGAQIALGVLFLGEQQLNIPMPSINRKTFKRSSTNTIYNDNLTNNSFDNMIINRR